MNKISGTGYFLLIMTFLLKGVGAEGAPAKYKVTDIPKNLLVNAKAVVRTNEEVFEISSVNKAVEKVTYAITILNDNGIENSVFINFYNKFLGIRKIKATLYDQYGNLVKNLSYLEIKDYAAIAGYSLYEDNRVKYIDPAYRATPFTIEYSYEIAFDGLMFYPDWKVYPDYNISVQNSIFKIITPRDFKFRYLEKNAAPKCIMTEKDDKSVYTWESQNMEALKKEPYCSSLEEFTPVVYAAPDDFEIGGYPGNLESWENFGKWISKLGEKRDELSKDEQEKIKGIVADKKNDIEKISALYEYMQDKVRYVSIQIGIGGWQPIDAETVNRLSYGDCKALANYMKTILDIAGINSYYTLATAGEDAPWIRQEFPSNQFNHAIVCVPVNHDTIWLECTDQHIPCGYLGTFTDDRPVLLTGPDGGRLVRTRAYSIDDNRKIRINHVTLNSNGDADSKIRTEYKGAYYDQELRVILMDYADKKKFVQEEIPVSSFSLQGFSHSEKKDIVPSVFEDIDLRMNNYGSVIGNRLIFNPNVIAREKNIPSMTKVRMSPINIRRSLNETDTVKFNIPDGFSIDRLPDKVAFSSKFGDYTAELLFDKDGLQYIRSFRLFKGLYPQADYDSFVNFFEKVSLSDERKISLTKAL